MKPKSLFSALLICCNICYSQVNVTNTGTLYIGSSSGMVFINGGFTNNSSSALTNNGSFYVKGDLSNAQASMTVGTGTLYLNGTSAQAVNGTQQFKTYNFISNNSAGVTLNNNLSISGAHTFIAGIITTSSTPNYLVYESGSSYSGDGDSRHVNGWVKKFGSTDFTFPVGNGTVERTIALNSLSAVSEFNVKYAAPTTNSTQVQFPLVWIDPFEYWNVNQVSGGSAVLFMNWDASKVAFPNWPLNTDIKVASWNGTNWTNAGGTASGTSTAGNITSNTVSSFSKFSFGGIAYPLPLTLINFSAKYIDNHTLLNWITADEQNVSHFIVERSDNGRQFYAVTKVPARNHSNLETYSAIDAAAINNIAFYRLRCVDIDGKEKFSKIVTIIIEDKNKGLLLLANPVSDAITLVAGNNLEGNFSYVLNNMNGQIVQSGNFSLQPSERHDLPLKQGIKNGVYSLTVDNKQNAFHYLVVIK